MMVSDTIQDVNQAVHNVAMATWVGGTVFGRVALNPAVRRIGAHTERGAVANAAWNAFNAVNAVALGAVGAGHLAGRLTELGWSNLSEREKPLVRAMDVFTATGVLTGALTGVQGVRLARQAPDGAVPVESGSRPAPETPPDAARLQRSINLLGMVNLLSGVGLVVSTGLFWRSAVSRPPLHRALRRSSATRRPGPGSVPVAAGAALTAAAVNELRRRAA
jgi:uncharacterized membrane protein